MHQTARTVEPPADAETIRSLRWTRDAKPLAEAAASGDATTTARALRRRLRGRFGAKGGPSDRLAARFPGVTDARGFFAAVEAGEWPALDRDAVGVALRLEGLRRFGGRLRSDVFWRAWDETRTAAAAIAAHAADSDPPIAAAGAGEVLFAAGEVFAGLKEAAGLLLEGRRRLRAEFDGRTDTDGTPHADLLPVLPAWFAAIARATSWARAADSKLWNAAFDERFAGLVRAVAVLCGPDGRLPFSSDADVRPILTEAARLCGDRLDPPARRLVGRLEKAGSPPVAASSPRKSDRKTPPVVQSDWAKLVASRSRWRAEADVVTVAHAGDRPGLSLVTLGRRVLSGGWGLCVSIDGTPVEATPEWESVSWFSDAEADYLELQWPLESDLVVCRQMLLTRGDHQLVVADAVSTPKRPAVRIDVESTLPLAAGVTAAEARPLRELRLDAGGFAVRAFPLGLPMNRVDGADGGFEIRDGSLVLRQAGQGGVYAPIVFDWGPARRSAFADWRRLTVTEGGRRLAGHEASGHRLRVGSRQLLLHRGLDGSRAKRAVLGHHHGYESVIGRFTGDGEVEPLVLVE